MAILSPDEARRMARMEFAIVVQTDLCAFLNAAQNFPNMSKENICLLILQFPNATDLLTETEWRQCGSTLLPNAQAITLITDEKNVVYVYDISQTNKHTAEEPVPDAEKAYHALVDVLKTDVIELENTQERMAYYHEKKWYVNLRTNYEDRFYYIICHLIAQVLESEKDIDSITACDMAAYMICRKYGVSTSRINTKVLQRAISRLSAGGQEKTIYAAMNCLNAPVFRDLKAIYTGQTKDRELQRKKEEEEQAKKDAAQKEKDEARIQLLANQQAYQMAEMLAQQKVDAFIQSVPAPLRGGLEKIRRKES